MAHCLRLIWQSSSAWTVILGLQDFCLCNWCLIQSLPRLCNWTWTARQLSHLFFCAAVMGSQVTSGFFSGLKEAGANLLPSIWGNDASPANSSGQESDHGIGDMGIDSEKSVRVL